MRFGALGSVVVAMALAAGGRSPAEVAQSPDPPSQGVAGPAPSHQAPATLDPIVIQARRDREIKRQIAKFVTGVAVTSFDESLQRWNQPICPLIVGIPNNAAEFMRARIFEVAKDSSAPVGSENCTANLVVVITDQPNVLVENWFKGLRGVFNSCGGLGPVRRFLQSNQPVRVFYNAKFTAAAGARGAGALELDNLNIPFPDECLHTDQLGTHLKRGSVQSMTSVIIVVDGRQTTKINMGQLADYVAMIGLAQFRIRAETGEAPSILHIFEGSDPQAQGLTPWDQAFLHSLYVTDQASVLEVPEIEDRMFRQLVGR